MLLLLLQWSQESSTMLNENLHSMFIVDNLSFKLLEKLYLASNTISTGSVALDFSIPQFTQQEKMKKD